MNIRIANNEDKKAWNEVASKAENSTYAHTWEWKEVIENGFGIESLCLVAEDNTGEIVGIYPGFLQPLKIKNVALISKRLKNLYSPFYHTWDYGGPCVLPEADEKVLEKLVIEMERFAKKKGAITLRISPFEGDELKKIMLKSGYRISERLTSVIDLTKSEEELWEGLNKKTRTPIRKARKLRVTITRNNTEYSLNVFFNILCSLSKSKGFYCPNFNFFKRVVDVLDKKGMVKTYLANYEDKSVGASLVLCFKDMVVTRYWAVLPEYYFTQANNLLVWEILMDGKTNGYKRCDLGGMPSNKKEGRYIFKSGWGGEIKHVDWHVKYVRFGNIVNMYKKIKNI